VDGPDDRFATGGAKPPPDNYGFFAGAAPQKAASDQFGSATPTARPVAPVPAPPPASAYGPPTGQPYGAPPTGQPYGGLPTGQPYGGLPTGQPYGAPPTGQPYGAPPTGQPYGAPATPVYAPGHASGSDPARFGRNQIIVAVVVVLLAVGAAGGGWNVWKQHQDIGVPVTLGGFAQNNGPAAEQAMTSSRAELRKEDPGKKAVVMAYGDPKSSFVFFIAVRGKLASFEKDFAQGGATGARRQVGHNTCAAMFVGFMCERSSSHLTEGVFAVSKTGTVDQVSAMLDEAWNKA
jgi:hypothetical protein